MGWFPQKTPLPVPSVCIHPKLLSQRSMEIPYAKIIYKSFIKSRGNLKVNQRPKSRYTLKRDENGNYTFGTCKKKKKTFKTVSEKVISDPYDINTISDTESDSSRTLEKIRALLIQKSGCAK